MYIDGFYLLNITLTSNWVLIDSLQIISGLEEFVRLFFRCFHFFCTFALDSPSLRKRCCFSLGMRRRLNTDGESRTMVTGVYNCLVCNDIQSFAGLIIISML